MQRTVTYWLFLNDVAYTSFIGAPGLSINEVKAQCERDVAMGLQASHVTVDKVRACTVRTFPEPDFIV